MMAKITMPSSRWPAVANPILAQLLFWRPVPEYHPSTEALAPALLIIDLLRSALADGPPAARSIRTPPPTPAWSCCRSCTAASSATLPPRMASESSEPVKSLALVVLAKRLHG